MKSAKLIGDILKHGREPYIIQCGIKPSALENSFNVTGLLQANCLNSPNPEKDSERLCQLFAITAKSGTLRLAPPTSPPSMSSIAKRPAAFLALQDPPYWMVMTDETFLP